MRPDADDKMFAPLRRRADPISPVTLLVEVLGGHAAGVTAAGLADELLNAGLAIGTRAPVRKRVEELLEDLEQAARVERIADGRYRVVRA